MARAAVEIAKLNLSYTEVRAPVSGVVSRRTAEIGQVVQPGQPLLAVVGLCTDPGRPVRRGEAALYEPARPAGPGARE